MVSTKTTEIVAKKPVSTILSFPGPLWPWRRPKSPRSKQLVGQEDISSLHISMDLPQDPMIQSNRFGYRFGYWFGYLTPNLIVQWRQNVPSPSPTYGQSIWGSSKLRACQRASTGVPWAPGTALRHDLGTLEATWMAHHGLGNLTTKGL